MKTIGRRDYLRFFEEVLAHYEEDFPSGLIERETVTQVPGCKILKTYDIARWSVAHLGMYEFTGEESYRQRALELVRGVVSGYLRTPRALWDYYWINTPQGLAACREAYRAVPAHATWHGYAWWHVGGAAEPLGLSQICDILDRTGGWPDRAATAGRAHRPGMDDRLSRCSMHISAADAIPMPGCAAGRTTSP